MPSHHESSVSGTRVWVPTTESTVAVTPRGIGDARAQLKTAPSRVDTTPKESHHEPAGRVGVVRWGGAIVTSDQGSDIPPALHPKLTVARGRLPARLGGLDARIVRSEDLMTAAEALAADRCAERTALHDRLVAAAARAAHDLDTATSQLDHLRASRQTLLDGASWAVAQHGSLTTHLDALTEARDVLEARLSDQRAARESLDRVLEQRTVASAAINDADVHVEMLDGVAMDESGLRRELEAAGQAVRAAHEAHARTVDDLQARLAEQTLVTHRAEALLQRQAAGRSDDPGAGDALSAVADALDSWRLAAANAGPDEYTTALANAFGDLFEDLAELRSQRGAVPDASELQLAEDQVSAAARELERVSPNGPPQLLSDAERAEIEAAHAVVEDALCRTDCRLRKASSAARLAAAEVAERALLDRHGFGSYLEVVLSGARPSRSSPELAAAESRYIAARDRRDRLQRAALPSPELEHLGAEWNRLLAEAVAHLGVDPGEELIELLRSHPAVPASVVEVLRDALHAAGVVSVGISLDRVAADWLADQARAAEERCRRRAELDQIDVELEAVERRGRELSVAVEAARLAEASAAENVDLARRSVDAVEAELTARADGDAAWLKQAVAAEQLRIQIEALASTLDRAEADARERCDRASVAVDDAQGTLDHAQRTLDELAHEARSLADQLPIDRRPGGDRLASLPTLAGLLQDHATVMQPAIDAAEETRVAAVAKVEAALQEADAAGPGTAEPRSEDVVDGFVAVLSVEDEGLLVLQEPFGALDPDLRPRLLEALRDRSAASAAVLVTEDPVALGWAIELPAEDAAMMSVESVLNLLPRNAEKKRTKASKSSATQSVREPAAHLTAAPS